MKRMHVHVSVDDIPQAVGFYSALFAAKPAVVKPDYAKWMLDDPRVNFAISQRSQTTGVNHLGVQAETEEELAGIHAKLQQADGAVVAEKGVHCCYANSDKYWVTDPSGVAWETFHSLGNIPIYGDAEAGQREASQSGCCAPTCGVAALS